MKYCVIANFSFDTPAKRDQMSQAIKDKIAGKITWGAVVVSQGISEENRESTSVEIRFDSKVDMDGLFALIKDRIETIPVLKGFVGKHNCSHDEVLAKPCVILEEYSK